MEYNFSEELDFSKLKSYDTISFVCKCGEKATIQKRKFTEPLCRKCKLRKKRAEGSYDSVVKNMKATIVRKYGSEENLNKLLAEKRKKTNLEKYGVEDYFASDDFKEKRKDTLKSKYGSMEQYEKHRIDKAEETFRNNHSMPKGSFLHQAFVDKYGVENARDLKNVNDKIKDTCLKRYGATSPLGNKDINRKGHETFLKKYGVKSTLSFSDTRKKIEGTMMLKYGVTYPGASSKLMRDRWSHYEYDEKNFDSSWELAYYIWLKDHHINFEYHPDVSFKFIYNSKEHCCLPDFKVKDKIVEIKGAHFLKEDKWVNPFCEEQNGLYEAKHQCLKEHNVEIITDCSQYLKYVKDTYGKDFLLFCKNSYIDKTVKYWCSQPFPYYKKKDNMSFLDAIRYFHKSIWEASKKGLPSPLQIWANEKMMRNVVKNRLEYSGYIDEETLRRGICVCYKAKVSVFKPAKAIKLINEYLNDCNEIFDPFSGFSGRMLAAESLGKHYIGQDINSKHIDESKAIAEYFGYQPTLKVQDVTQDDNASYEYLFTCPPYGGKEHWNANNDETEKSCDEWIELCLSKYHCKKYLFVVDDTEKYKDHIVGKIQNRDMYGSNEEKVILLH